jgi:hypothetical protein
MVVIIGLQAGAAARLLADADAGTPQRFVLFSANDPTIPAQPPSAPRPWAGVRPPLPTPWGPTMTLAPAVLAEVQALDLASQRGGLVLEELDSHRVQNRVKEAAMLALLAGRFVISEDDWRLAGLVMDTSDALRGWIRARRAKATAELDEQRGQRAAVVETAKERAHVKRISVALVAKVRAAGSDGISLGKLRIAVTSQATRHLFDEALRLAVANGEVELDGKRVQPVTP